jgi:hypothetical protein
LREPKVIVVAGIQAIHAISGNSTLTEFFKNHTIDLYVPGAPANPDVIGRGIAELIK